MEPEPGGFAVVPNRFALRRFGNRLNIELSVDLPLHLIVEIHPG
jgi:hypothetical protein